MDYIIEYQNGKTTAEAIDKLQKAVKENIQIGFVPVGGVTIGKEKKYYLNQWNDEYTVCQAMVKN